jgi:hypothetical protein
MGKKLLRTSLNIFAVGVLAMLAAQLSVAATSWPTVQFSPNPVNFGYVGLGGTKVLPVTVTNTGDSNLVIGGDDVAHGNFGFRMSIDRCIGKTLMPGESCTVQIGFNAEDPWLNAGGYYIIFDNATGGYQYVFLYGKSKKE